MKHALVCSSIKLPCREGLVSSSYVCLAFSKITPEGVVSSIFLASCLGETYGFENRKTLGGAGGFRREFIIRELEFRVFAFACSFG